jgi:exodeoxyribonuclease (lambda-induced)
MKQRTAEWFHARLGCVTASRVADVLAMTKNGPSERRQSYLYQLVAERLTGLSTEHYVTADMQRGIDCEAEARTLYELRAGRLVDEVAFVRHPTIPMCGASPDGVAGDVLVEIKCPRQERHVATLLTGKIPADYLPQMNLQMACTGATGVDYVSFCAAMPEPMQLVVLRHARNQTEIDEMEEKIRAFLVEVEAAAIRARELAEAGEE